MPERKIRSITFHSIVESAKNIPDEHVNKEILLSGLLSSVIALSEASDGDKTNHLSKDSAKALHYLTVTAVRLYMEETGEKFETFVEKAM